MFSSIMAASRRIAPIPCSFVKPAAPSMATTDSSGASNQSSARYPKRKRAEVQYYPSSDDSDAFSDSDFESDIIPVPRKRMRSTKPLPPNKIFPFLSLPPELRNKIYALCLPSPTKLTPELSTFERHPSDDNSPSTPDVPRYYFRAKQRSYRRSIELLPTLSEVEAESLSHDLYYRRRRARRGTGRGRPAPPPPPSDNGSDDATATDPRTPVLNILAVCKSIYAEAAPLFYTSHLLFIDTDALFAFASRLSPRTAKLIRHIEVCSWSSSRSRKNRGYAAMAMLAAKGVTELDSLDLNCSLGYFRSYGSMWGRGRERREQLLPKRVARKVFRECGDWLEVVGSLRGVGEAVDVVRVGEENFEGWVLSAQAGEGSEEEKMVRGRGMYRRDLVRLVGGGR
ncbi:hypothetical protein K491DRAFT_393386 [Lophiostoma macrostomum CBS 122681]|uniref:2EXR domain-containing protein n=1 Tax=Lophiostoma macrostomum CBS 122681 TaxID=1314788 RepID=A0A6A6TAF5_9PLEO|nr:hypothetical protein K491DRAFT_393386 [Lophiostoma macrostomum CBS 122681]